VRRTLPVERALVVSVHDVAPATTTETRRWLADLDTFGVRGVLLAVPGPWRGSELADAPESAALLRDAAARGHEIALHGWTHTAQPGGGRTRRLSGAFAARGAGEFWALDEAAARDRIERGRASLAAAGLDMRGFVPPGYLASPGARQALAASGLHYWTSHLFIHDLTDGSRLFAPSVSHRPARVRDAGSSASDHRVLERSGELLIDNASRALPRPRVPLRLALHPDDLHRPGLREVTLRAIERALRCGARATTYSHLLAGLRQDATAKPAAAR
jgi:predicted deacetylase